MRVAGRGARTVDGLHEVDSAAWSTTEPEVEAGVALRSTVRHQVWLALLVTPLVLWVGVRVIGLVRNSTRNGA